MQQASLFDAPAIPVAGLSPRAREASRSGQQKVLKCWTERQSALLQLLAGGPKTRVELAGLLHWPISSVCSVLDSVRGEIESAGLELVEWPDRSVTKRERFQIRRDSHGHQ